MSNGPRWHWAFDLILTLVIIVVACWLIYVLVEIIISSQNATEALSLVKCGP